MIGLPRRSSGGSAEEAREVTVAGRLVALREGVERIGHRELFEQQASVVEDLFGLGHDEQAMAALQAAQG